MVQKTTDRGSFPWDAPHATTGAFDNPRGFFERSDVIAQNDAFLKHQRTNWALKSEAYDARAGLAAALRPGEGR